MDELEPNDPTPRGGNLPRILVLVGCGVLIAVGGCAAVLGGLSWFGLSALEQEMCAGVEAEAVVLEHLGRVTDCEVEMMRSLGDEADVMYFELTGTKASGSAVVEYDSDLENIVGGTLTLDDGRTFELRPR